MMFSNDLGNMHQPGALGGLGATVTDPQADQIIDDVTGGSDVLAPILNLLSQPATPEMPMVTVTGRRFPNWPLIIGIVAFVLLVVMAPHSGKKRANRRRRR